MEGKPCLAEALPLCRIINTTQHNCVAFKRESNTTIVGCSTENDLRFFFKERVCTENVNYRKVFCSNKMMKDEEIVFRGLPSPRLILQLPRHEAMQHDEDFSVSLILHSHPSSHLLRLYIFLLNKREVRPGRATGTTDEAAHPPGRQDHSEGAYGCDNVLMGIFARIPSLMLRRRFILDMSQGYSTSTPATTSAKHQTRTIQQLA